MTTPSLLESAARFLGAEYEAQYGKYVAQVEIDDGGDMYNALSPGDLLNALLRRFIELGYAVELVLDKDGCEVSVFDGDKTYISNSPAPEASEGCGAYSAPLDAVLAAVAALQSGGGEAFAAMEGK